MLNLSLFIYLEYVALWRKYVLISPVNIFDMIFKIHMISLVSVHHKRTRAVYEAIKVRAALTNYNTETALPLETLP